MPRYNALPPSVVPRGFRRQAAAQYIGVSAGKFDQMVSDGRMPGPKFIDGCKVWDVRQLELAFDNLPGQGQINEWDSVKPASFLEAES